MVEIEHTPNPDTLKFLPQKKVSEVGPVELLKNDKSIKSPLVNNIFSVCVTFFNVTLFKIVARALIKISYILLNFIAALIVLMIAETLVSFDK